MTRVRRIGIAVAALGVATAPSFAQAPAADPRASSITIAWLDVPVADALERLAASGPMNLVWDAATVRAARAPRVSCRAERATPEQVLGCVTREAGLDWYRLSSGTYVVIARAEAAPGYGAVAGFVVDAVSGAPVPAARVWIADAPPPRVVGDDGGFVFDRLLPGRYELMVQAIGYRPVRRGLEIAREGRERTRVSLEPIGEASLPIIVSGVRAGTASGALGGTVMADSALASVVAPPAFVMPGAATPLGVSRRDGTGDLHLQGGDIGEHPWRLDGVPLFDAAALSGLLGTVAPIAVDRLAIRRSGFRAADGSFAAGAIDLTHDLGAGRARAARAIVAADPLAVTARLSTPLRLAGATGEAMVAAREGTWGATAPAALTSAIRTWNAPDPVLLQRLSGFGALPGMHDLEQARFVTGGRETVGLRDLHAAARLSWQDLRTVEASAFRTSHAMSWAGTAADASGRALRTRDAYAWRTTGGQAAVRALLGTRVRQYVQARAVVHTLGHEADMAMALPGGPAMAGREGNRVEEIGLRAEWTTGGATGWELAGGVDLAQTRASVDLANAVLRPITAGARVARATAWGDATWPLGGATFLETGVRITQLETGRTYAEPRVALRGEGGGVRPWAWRVAGGGYHQFVSQFDIAATAPMAFVPSVRFWLPMDGRSGVATA
ncbi:MAG: carboxypeptidase-like regulatory domain-containing protein [Gemmatimonadaceae bacterium]|nr:carboxypeptidase-like regulatory domain-containing protein [Gemmatimonadaceae bacterium]